MVDLTMRAARRRRVMAGGAILCAPILGAEGHHSISAVYDASRREAIEGVVAEFQFVNPHPFVIVTVQGTGGPETWRLELDNRFELARIGITADTLRPGDRISASGSGGRGDPFSLYVRRLDRSDGFRYEQVGSSPRVNGLPAGRGAGPP
jgi:hypothetical protein